MMDPLQELYPFLHGQAKNPQREKMALLEPVRQKSAESRNVKAQFFAAHAEALVSHGRLPEGPGNRHGDLRPCRHAGG